MSQNNSNTGGHGAKLSSWLVCLVMLAGVVVGGIAVVAWNWTWFWIGVGVFVVGVILAAAVRIMDDVTEYGGGGAGQDPSSASY